MGAVAPIGHPDHTPAPNMGALFDAVSTMLGGADPASLLAAIGSQPAVDADLAAEVAALRCEVEALRADLAPVVEAVGMLLQLPKVRKAMSRVDM